MAPREDEPFRAPVTVEGGGEWRRKWSLDRVGAAESNGRMDRFLGGMFGKLSSFQFPRLLSMPLDSTLVVRLFEVPRHFLHRKWEPDP